MRRAVTLALLLAVAGAVGAWGQSESTLRGRIESGKARERTLASAAGRLGRLERAAARDVAVLEGRVASVEAELEAAEARVQETAVRLEAARARVQRLQARLAEVRARLAVLLRARYESGEPGIMSVVLDSHGFEGFLETIAFLRRIQHADTRLLAVVRAARRDAARERQALTVLERRRRLQADAIRRRRDALTGMLDGLRRRRAALAAAHAARAAALARTRAGRRQAQIALSRLLAARARAAVATSGPGGPWSIPFAVVQCESGGQNLPPNGAGASGYYQFLPETWRDLGGSTPQAYQAPKAEQDRLAARLWAGGSGARNWVCSRLVAGV